MPLSTPAMLVFLVGKLRPASSFVCLVLAGPLLAAELMSSTSFETTPFEFTSGTTLLETGQSTATSTNFSSVQVL